MSEIIKAFAANEPKGKFEPFEYETGELGQEDENSEISRIIEAFKHLESDFS